LDGWGRRGRRLGSRVGDLVRSSRIQHPSSTPQAGATLTPDLGPADIILGVKEVPVAKLLQGKTYLFFSHTHKGQTQNMPLLRAMMERGVTLVDYELLRNPETEARYVFFSRFAGIAGRDGGLPCGLPSRAAGDSL
jgi:alpha-aminoadipic semialdehyde synthase